MQYTFKHDSRPNQAFRRPDSGPKSKSMTGCMPRLGLKKS